MSLIVNCPNCSQRYQIANSAQGKRVRCKQCGNAFSAVPAETHNAPLDPLSGDLANLAGLEASPLEQAANPLGATFSGAAWTAPARSAVSNPSGGPTDAKMRLVCGGMLAFGLLLAMGSLLMERATGTVYLAITFLIPLMVCLGIAGLISPNVVRACGKFGGHLPVRYKIMGWGVIGLSFVFMLLMLAGFFLAGFEPDRPGRGSPRPGLTRSDTAKVLERIGASYAASPNAHVVRTASFSVFSINGAGSPADAERALAPAAGYVAGSFKLSPDRKTVTFQYKGDKEIGHLYALLLPGPTGIFMDFTPKFEEPPAANEAKAEEAWQAVRNRLKALGAAYHVRVDSTGKAPTNWAELKQAGGDAEALSALETEGWVVAWGTHPRDAKPGSSEFVLAYSPQGLETEHFVLFMDTAVSRIPPDELKARLANQSTGVQ